MKLKKVTALTLAAAMTFSLVGCGGGDTPTEAPLIRQRMQRLKKTMPMMRR